MGDRDKVNEKLKYLQLLSKVTSELENNLGMGDKTLAEFVIDIALTCENFKDFDKKLRENGAELPIDFVDKIHRLVRHLHPKFAVDRSQSAKASEASAPPKMSGLAIPDSKDRSKRIDEELVQEGLEREQRGDLHSTNEEAAGSRSTGDRMSARDRAPVHQQEKERPLELGEVYRGRVTNVIDIGCFVQLIGVSARRQGLVHVSQLENRRVEDPRDVVKREEESERSKPVFKKVGLNRHQLSH